MTEITPQDVLNSFNRSLHSVASHIGDEAMLRILEHAVAHAISFSKVKCSCCDDMLDANDNFDNFVDNVEKHLNVKYRRTECECQQ